MVLKTSRGIVRPDPCRFRPDRIRDGVCRDTNGLTRRSNAINTGIKNLVLISLGQSLRENACPTLYTPSNTAKVDVFNPWDGQMYAVGGPLPGTTYSGTVAQGGLGPGNVMAEVADKFAASVFDRVILVPMAIGGTLVWDHATLYGDSAAVVMARLARLGITPGTTNFTFGIEWGQGSSDAGLGVPTPQAVYSAGLSTVITQWFNAGFSGRFFIAKETYYGGAVSVPIQTAQWGLVNGTTIFQSGDTDSLNSGNRQDVAGHWNDVGRPACATLIFNAMQASGAPYV